MEFTQTGRAKAPHFLLLGNPVDHSLSPLMHNTAARYHNMPARYFALKLQSSEFHLIPEILENEHLKGVNITIPYKSMIIDYVDLVDPVCDEISAVNTIVKENNVLKGFNTDTGGFMAPLKPYLKIIEDKPAIIFGTGGVSRAVIYALNKSGVQDITLVSRNPGKMKRNRLAYITRVASYNNWTNFVKNAKLIVNATPLGMQPHLKQSPVEDYEITYLSNKICYDLVYNPMETKFLKLAEKADAITINGIEMLIHQGSKSFELWTGKSFPISSVRERLYEQFNG